MQILIYTTENCQKCELLKAFLQQMKLVYVEKRVVQSPDAENGVDLISISDFIEQVPGIKTLPQVIVDGELIGGFEKFKQYYYER